MAPPHAIPSRQVLAQVLTACLLLAGGRCAEDTADTAQEEMVIGDIARQWSAMVDAYQRKQQAEHHGVDLFPVDLMTVMRKHSEDDVLDEISHDDHRCGPFKAAAA